MRMINQFVSDYLLSEGCSLVGFADLSAVPYAVEQGMPYGVCFAIALQAFPSLTDTPSAAYYHEYKSVSAKLREIGFALEEKLRLQGCRAYALVGNKQDARFTTPLPLKTLATRAGLGWIGKSAVFVTKEYGAAIRLGGVITDMPLDCAEPIDISDCGNCQECVNHCPAQAISGKNWVLGVSRDELLNPYLCKEKVKQRGEAYGVTEGTCGICLAACPYTKHYMDAVNAENKNPADIF